MNNSKFTDYGPKITDHSVPIIIEETSGIDRCNEPVTVGIPFPRGTLINDTALKLYDQGQLCLPLQSQVLAKWHDGSAKWVLLDFQASTQAHTRKELKLCFKPSRPPGADSNKTPLTNSIVRGQGAHADKITTTQNPDTLTVNTGVASFFVNKVNLKPFDRVVIGDNDILSHTNSKIALTDETGTEYEPKIDNIIVETKGELRTTLKFEGQFKCASKSVFANFVSRVSFYVNSSIIKMEFTIHNPGAAEHTGGLWDLGDPGSIFFNDLSIYSALNGTQPTSMNHTQNNELSAISYQLNDESSAMSHEQNCNNNLIIYQDSSGGENWKSLNHVNRNGEVKNSFRGYKIFSQGETVKEGLRANPIVSIRGNNRQISAAIQNFWQNFPKSIEAEEKKLIVRLFPEQYNDLFELQAGEQKTHTVFLNFNSDLKGKTGLDWVQNPLIPRSTPKWYAKSKAITYLIPEKENIRNNCTGLINCAQKGDNTFFDRREIIDEYGWRNFGELYADHEAVGHEGPNPLISHYNNQYDGIYGTLVQYVSSGNIRWFLLANQLCNHVKDIDVYHTDNDRPEYNHGLFWHTNHYTDAQTSTHRCYSRKQVDNDNIAAYGGGPSLSHVYPTGLLLHYYLTGSLSSLETIKEVFLFVENNIDCENSVLKRAINGVMKLKCYVEDIRNNQPRSTDVYKLDGPSRESGNALNTLLDGYVFTDNVKALVLAENLIKNCVHPYDNIGKMDLLDTERKWFYVIFLQSLGKYLDIKSSDSNYKYDYMWQYARKCLINYAQWMVEHEYPYLEKPEKLEYPNETWAAQEFRKCNVLLYAAKYSEHIKCERLLEKANYFYNKGISCLLEFETKTLTRPVVLLMLNGMMLYGFKECHGRNSELNNISPEHLRNDFKRNKFLDVIYSTIRLCLTFSIKREIQFLKWRLISK